VQPELDRLMKAFFNWTIKNISNIFSLLGIGLTLYFGIYYVPEWLKEAQRQKEINAHENLVQSIKELVFSDTLCSYTEIDVLIKAKEQKLKHSFSLTAEQVLISVQEAFMQDKFLSLSKRKQLISEIEILKKNIPTVNQQDKTKGKKSSNDLYGLLSAVISLVLVIVGVLSFYKRNKEENEKQEEIDNQINDVDISKELTVSDSAISVKYEEEILKVIKDYPGVEIQPLNVGENFDFRFLYQGRLYYVEVKYLSRNKVGLKSLYSFMFFQKGLEGIFWFIYNTDVTPMVRKEVSHINKVTQLGRRIELINAESASVLKRKLPTLLQ
jgi:hypothetical protein